MIESRILASAGTCISGGWQVASFSRPCDQRCAHSLLWHDNFPSRTIRARLPVDPAAIGRRLRGGTVPAAVTRQSGIAGQRNAGRDGAGICAGGCGDQTGGDGSRSRGADPGTGSGQIAFPGCTFPDSASSAGCCSCSGCCSCLGRGRQSGCGSHGGRVAGRANRRKDGIDYRKPLAPTSCCRDSVPACPHLTGTRHLGCSTHTAQRATNRAHHKTPGTP